MASRLPTASRLPAAFLVSIAFFAQASPALPPATALEAVSVPGGWIVQEGKALRLLDAGGAVRAATAIRGKHLDARATATEALAATLDADLQRVLVARFDLATGRLARREFLPEPPFPVEALCLHRDRDRVDHLFLVGKDGQAAQWVLDGERAREFRRLAFTPHAKHCRVDDATATLFLGEPDLGLWAYAIGGEGVPARSPVALRKPFGALASGAGAIAVVPRGVAFLDTRGRSLVVAERQDSSWKTVATQPVAFAKGAGEISLAPEGLVLRDRAGGRWEPVTLSLPRTVPAPEDRVAVVRPRGQTTPVARLGDAADDPAIWVHPTDPSKSVVLGTNKKQGLLAYDLTGRERQLLETGRLNNVDVRQGVDLGGTKLDLAVATNRDDNSLAVYVIDSGGIVSEAGRIPTDLHEIYGTCLYQPPGGGLDVLVNDKDGRYQQVRLAREGERFTGRVVRAFRLESQPEGCVADDVAGRLFVGEEKRGLWTLSADAAVPARPQLVLPVGPVLHADVEGMAIYRAPTGSYVVVSSQGNDTYVVLDLEPPHRLRGVFRIAMDAAAGIDGTSETDGIDITSANLGGPYSRGLLVVQDGHKRLPDGPQNFKYVAWEDVAKALALP